MTDQTNLLGDVPVDPNVKLTGRQRLALEHIAKFDRLASDELGAFLHEERRSRTGRGHDRDERCEYCGDEGSQMGAALRAKGLVRYSRGAGTGDDSAGWYVVDRCTCLQGERTVAVRASCPVHGLPDPSSSSQLGRSDPWPAGF